MESGGLATSNNLVSLDCAALHPGYAPKPVPRRVHFTGRGGKLQGIYLARQTMSVQAKNRYTPEEYIEIELSTREKHEFFDGEIFATVGASQAHNLIALNTGAELRDQLLSSRQLRRHIPSFGAL